jgi:hypothetical protein
VHTPGTAEFGYFLPAPIITARAPGTYTSSVLYLGYDNQITASDDDNHDDLVIRLTATAVPEPATWAMMIAGFGLMGGAMRRRSAGLALAQSVS